MLRHRRGVIVRLKCTLLIYGTSDYLLSSSLRIYLSISAVLSFRICQIFVSYPCHGLSNFRTDNRSWFMVYESMPCELRWKLSTHLSLPFLDDIDGHRSRSFFLLLQTDSLGLRRDYLKTSLLSAFVFSHCPPGGNAHRAAVRQGNTVLQH